MINKGRRHTSKVRRHLLHVAEKDVPDRGVWWLQTLSTHVTENELRLC